MSLRESYKPIYESLDRSDLEKVGSFSAKFMQACVLKNNNEIASLIKEAMAEIVNDKDCLDALFGIVNFAGKFGSPMEKSAAEKLEQVIKQSASSEYEKVGADGGSSWITPERGLAVGALGLTATPLISHLVDKYTSKSKIKDSFRQILADHPELRENPDTARYFQAIADFSPKVAENPLVAGNVLKQMHQIGPGAATPALFKDLQTIDKDYSDITKNRQLLYGEAGRGVSGFNTADKGK